MNSNKKNKYPPEEKSTLKHDKFQNLNRENDMSDIIELPARIPPTVIKITRGFYNKDKVISKTARKLYKDICIEQDENKQQ